MRSAFLYALLLLLPATGAAQSDSLSVAQKQITEWLERSWNQRFQQPDSARHFGYHALEAARKAGLSRYEAQALNNIGVTYEAQGNYTTALEYAHQALTIFQELKEETEIANTCNNIGIICDEMGDFTRALKFYNEAYAHYKAADNIEKQAMVSINLGILFKAHGEYAKVIGYYHDAYAVYRQLNMSAELAFCEANLGSVYYYTKQYDSCLHYSLMAEKAFTGQRNLQSLPVARANAGMAYFEMDRKREAYSYLQQALEGHRSYNNRKEIAFVLIQLAKIHASEKKYNEAINVLLESTAIAESIGASQQVMDAAKLLSDYYGAISSFRNAWIEAGHYSMVRDSLFEQEKMRTIADYQTRYETDKKEHQITLLQQQTAIQQLELRQRNYLLVSLLLLTGLGVLFVYFLLNRRKMKADARLEEERHSQQENATRSIMIAEERERRRIAADLHDGVGQTLSVALMHIDRVHEQYAGDPEARLSSGKALSLLSESYEGIRNLSHRMIPKALLKKGLATAVRELVDNTQGGNIAVSLDIHGLEDRLPEQTETILYRIIQEAVHNAIKHAAAKTLSIQLIKDADGIFLNIEDDGKGFDPRILETSEGMGMKNLRSRVALLRGTIDIHSNKGKGTLISITVPAEN